eukprot:gene6322-7575_t
MVNGSDTWSFWTISGAYGDTGGYGNTCEEGNQGRPISDGFIVRLRHSKSNNWLHSGWHDGHKQQEVSVYDSEDFGDNWKVEVDTVHWVKGGKVMLKHLNTGKYLVLEEDVFNRRYVLISFD